MRLIRAATLCVADIERSIRTYHEWLDYELVERGKLNAELAAALGAPASAGAPMAVMQPASGSAIFLRFVEQAPHADYRPLRTYGWAAIEICVQDVLAVNARMEQAAPFEIIGPPNEIAGLTAIFPMQVRGPDNEIVYFTEIRDNLQEFTLPRAQSLIDHLFILVTACSDLPASLRWMAKYAGMQVGRENMDIVYTMISKAFGLPSDELHTIATMVHERDVFLELDQYPTDATARAQHPGALPPGVAAGSFHHPDFDALAAAAGEFAIGDVAHHDGAIYDGAPSLTLRDPDGTLIELIGSA